MLVVALLFDPADQPGAGLVQFLRRLEAEHLRLNTPFEPNRFTDDPARVVGSSENDRQHDGSGSRGDESREHGE